MVPGAEKKIAVQPKYSKGIKSKKGEERASPFQKATKGTLEEMSSHLKPGGSREGLVGPQKR